MSTLDRNAKEAGAVVVTRYLPIVLLAFGWLLLTAAFAAWEADPWIWAASGGLALVLLGSVLLASEVGHRVDDRRRKWMSSED